MFANVNTYSITSPACPVPEVAGSDFLPIGSIGGGGGGGGGICLISIVAQLSLLSQLISHISVPSSRYVTSAQFVVVVSLNCSEIKNCGLSVLHSPGQTGPTSRLISVEL